MKSEEDVNSGNPSECIRSQHQQQKRRIEEPSPDCQQIIVDIKRKFNVVERSMMPSPLIRSENAVSSEWLHMFESMPDFVQTEALSSLITRCNRQQIRHLHSEIAPYFQVDFLRHLPKELSQKILGYLFPRDLVLVTSVSHYWRQLAEDNFLWTQKCRQYAIKEFFPPNLARKENWTLLSDGIVTYSPPSSPSISRHQLQIALPNHCQQSSSSNAGTGQQFQSCLERSRWKAIYLRNHRISNNWRFCRSNAVCHLRGHDEHVITCLKLRGDRIVTGSDDCTLRVWSAATGRCTQVLSGHTGGVWALQLSADGKMAISGSTDRTIRVWNTDTGELIHQLNGHTSTVRCMSLRGNILVTGSRDCSIRTWNIVEGRSIQQFIGHLAAVRCVKFDGKTIVSGAYDHKIHVWNADEGVLEHVLEGHTNRVYSLHFVSERDLVISGSLDTTIRVWNVRTGECLQTLIGHQSLTSGMKLRDNWLVSANADSTIKVWNILDGTCFHTLAGPNKHASAVTGLRFLENGLVATSGDDGTVKLWDIAQGTFVCDLVKLDSSGTGGCVWRMKATPTLLICAVGSRNGTEDTKLVLMDFDAPYP